MPTHSSPLSLPAVLPIPRDRLLRLQRIAATCAAVALGAALLFGAAFAQPQGMHDAAHDTRHAFAFPCH
ncbi:MAG: CbtB-domain containing protein [Candidatus Lambdaproteobacteria bacterium]|nr:CbtB-domain containing protein [Candidatus Lambdaproteobacteria bacterium]